MVVAGASEEMRGFFAGLRMTSKRATADSSAALRNDKPRAVGPVLSPVIWGPPDFLYSAAGIE
jgi:hypothetical protein